MQKLSFLKKAFINGLLLCLCLTMQSSWAKPNKGIMKFSGVTNAPEIEGSAWILMEYNSGWVVAGNNINTEMPPASITKLMTNYVVFSKLKEGVISLQDDVSISEKAWRAEGSRMFANVNSKIKLQHLLKSTIIQSGNDAAIALAEHVSGSEAAFAQLMNETARKLGMSTAHFENSTGLPVEGHQMSAADIAILAAAIIRDFPDFYPWYKEKTYTHNEITQYNRNKLLWKYDMVDGLKTGHTQAAGYCLVGSAQKKGVRWIAVVLGTQSERHRERAVLSLLNYAYSTFETKQILDTQGGVGSAPVYQGETDTVRLQPANPVHVVIPVGAASKLKTNLKYSPYYTAPIKFAQPMGIATVTLNGQEISDVPLIAMSTIEQGPWWRRMVDSLRLSIFGPPELLVSDAAN